MEQKNYTEVLIDGRIYTLGGTEEEMYLQKVAAYINEKTGKIKKQDGFSRLSADFQAVMMELNIADDYFKEQERADRLAEQKAALEKEAYSLKHELITTQMKLENVEKEYGAEQKKARKLQRAADEMKLELETLKAVQAANLAGNAGIAAKRTNIGATVSLELETMDQDEDMELQTVEMADIVEIRAAGAADMAESQTAVAAEAATGADIVSGQEWSSGKGGTGSTRSARRRK